jgi:hypothetical protein
MFAPHDMVNPPMFNGVARPHRIRDLAAIALCLALIAAFVAHAVRPVQAAPVGSPALAATTAAPCPDVLQ